MTQAIVPARSSDDKVWPMVFTADGTGGSQVLATKPGDGQSYFVTGFAAFGGSAGSDFYILRKNVPEFCGATDTLTMADAAVLEPVEGDWALSFWIKFTAYATKTNDALIDKYDSSNGYLIQVTSAGKLKATVGDGTDTASVTGNTDVCDAEWHHVVVTIDAGSTTGLNIYLDGVSDVTTPGDLEDVDSITGGTQTLVVTGTAAQTFRLGPISIYKATIPSITTLYNKGVGFKSDGEETAITWALNLDEGQGTTSYDVVGVANGTLANIAWADDGIALSEDCLGYVGVVEADVIQSVIFPHAIKIGVDAPLVVNGASGSYKVFLFGYTDYSGSK